MDVQGGLWTVIAALIGAVGGWAVARAADRWRPGDKRPRWTVARNPLWGALLGAMGLGVLGWDFGPGIPWVCYGALVLLLLAMARIDRVWRLVPNPLVAAAVLPWLGLEVALGAALAPAPVVGAVSRMAAEHLTADLAARGLHGTVVPPWASMGWRSLGLGPWACGLVDGVVAALGVIAVMGLLSWVMGRFTGRRAVGMGDVKLLGVCALYLGCVATTAALFLACLLGLGAAWLHRNDRLAAVDNGPGSVASEKDLAAPSATFPWAPSIALATFLALVLGPLLVV